MRSRPDRTPPLLRHAVSAAGLAVSLAFTSVGFCQAGADASGGGAGFGLGTGSGGSPGAGSQRQGTTQGQGRSSESGFGSTEESGGSGIEKPKPYTGATGGGGSSSDGRSGGSSSGQSGTGGSTSPFGGPGESGSTNNGQPSNIPANPFAPPTTTLKPAGESGFGRESGATTTFGGSGTAPGALGESQTRATIELDPNKARQPDGATGTLEGTGSGGPSGGEQPATTFTAPGLYGEGGVRFTAGQGRLARPRFRYTVSASIGFDDNVFSTPTDIQDQVFIIPRTPTIRGQTVSFRNEISNIGNSFTITQVPVFQDVVLFEGTDEQRIVIPAEERQASFITELSGSAQVTFVNRRTVFVMDLNAGVEAYWDRPNDTYDPTGTLSLTYIQRVSPRVQVSARATAQYTNQPDLSRAGGNRTANSGNTFSSSAKLDLSYQWSSRFSTVSSVSATSLTYEEEAFASRDYRDVGLGNEFRWRYSPRITLVAENRYSQISYPDAEGQNANTLFFLLGADTRLSGRLSASTRLGYSLRTFETTGEQSTAPYGELTMTYRINAASSLSLNSRFGFEPSVDGASETTSFRLGLTYSQAFNSRFSYSSSVNLSHRVLTVSSSDSQFTDDSVDFSLSLNYILSRRWSTSLSYNFTTLITELGFSDYYRNRLFLRSSYEF